MITDLIAFLIFPVIVIYCSKIEKSCFEGGEELLPEDGVVPEAKDEIPKKPATTVAPPTMKSQKIKKKSVVTKIIGNRNNKSKNPEPIAASKEKTAETPSLKTAKDVRGDSKFEESPPKLCRTQESHENVVKSNETPKKGKLNPPSSLADVKCENEHSVRARSNENLKLSKSGMNGKQLNSASINTSKTQPTISVQPKVW